MKQTRDMDIIQERMKPGVLTRGGLLGTDTRSLVDILETDDAAVKRLGTDHKSIAKKMTELRNAGRKGLGQPVRAGKLEAVTETYRGRLVCPFGDTSRIAKSNTAVRNTASGKEVSYTDLNIHLIREHGFYQGKGSVFRLEPARLVEVLGIAGEED